MKFWGSFALQNNDPQTIANFLTQTVTNLSQWMTGKVNFGDNIQCTLVDIQITAAETPVPHNLNIVPIGFLVLNQDGPAIIYSGPSPYNAKYIYLKSSTDVTAKIAVIGG